MEVPDGYEPWPDPVNGPGLRLLDPEMCPAGHRFNWGVRQSLARCAQHGEHNTWMCACGRWIWRVDGVFVGEMPACVSSGR